MLNISSATFKKFSKVIFDENDASQNGGALSSAYSSIVFSGQSQVLFPTNIAIYVKWRGYICTLAIEIICDRACENRACGLKYTMSFNETYLNAEM